MANNGAILGLGVAAIGVGLALALNANKSAIAPASQKAPSRKGQTNRKSQIPVAKFTVVSVPYQSKRSGKTAYYKEVVESPAELKRQAEETLQRSISDEVFVLGTMVASEAGSVLPAKVGVAWAAMNAANAAKKNIIKQVIPAGVFGSQGFGGRGYAATSHPPTALDLKVAHNVIAKLIPDPTSGAVQWDAPRVQQKGVEEGWAGYQSNAEQIAQKRIASGKEVVYLPDVDPDYIRFWRPKPKTKAMA